MLLCTPAIYPCNKLSARREASYRLGIGYVLGTLGGTVGKGSLSELLTGARLHLDRTLIDRAALPVVATCCHLGFWGGERGMQPVMSS